MTDKVDCTWRGVLRVAILQLYWDSISTQTEWQPPRTTTNTRPACEKELVPFYITVLTGTKLVQPLWKSVWSFIKKLTMGLPYDPAIHFWLFTQRPLSQHITQIPACCRSSQHFAQWLSYGGSLGMQAKANGERECALYTQCDFFSPVTGKEWNEVVGRKMDSAGELC